MTGKGKRLARAAKAVLGKYRLESAQEEYVSQWYAVTSRHPRNTRACSFKIQALIDSWNDLTTADTPGFLNSKAGEILSTSPQQTPSSKFFCYIHRACGRVSTPYRINLPARDIYAPAQDG